ncbi:MAG TPA: TolC family protein [Vicinamibacterales bacterium]|jgi:outer membrane protein TolC|nr:TolC family protein [Vicinamibacterales bacterium]
MRAAFSSVAIIGLLMFLFPGTVPVLAQPASHSTDSQLPRLELAALQEAAINADPRFRELRLQQTRTDLTVANIQAERLPSIAAEAQTQYQSDVPTPPSGFPGLPPGQPLFRVAKGTVDASLRIDQRILDRTIPTRLAVERAQLAEDQARVRSTLFALRQEVNDAFFTAALLQERAHALSATIADLELQLRETSARVREGAALATDASAVEATLLQRQQDDEELRANRATALARLSDLTGRAITDADELGVPDLQAAVADASRDGTTARARPEYEQFARARDRLARQQDAATAREQPRVSAFARVGVGRPGLNFLSDQVESYGLAGLQLRWTAWTWGAAAREREALGIQREIVAADEGAFTKGIGRSADADRLAIDRLDRAMVLDQRIVTLREEIVRTTGIRFREGVATASEYLDRSTELLAARFTRVGHGIELAEARARFLTTLGLEVR